MPKPNDYNFTDKEIEALLVERGVSMDNVERTYQLASNCIAIKTKEGKTETFQVKSRV